MDEDFDVAISTGAAAALPILPRALLKGKKVVYIESVSRFEGPSLTGRIMGSLPGVKLFTQHPEWANSKWIHKFSVLDDFVSVETGRSPSERLRIFVSLGTIRPYRFDRLVDRVRQIAPHGDVCWQLGETVRDDLPGKVNAYLPAAEFEKQARSADVVVTHAGVGTALALLDLGIYPVLVARRSSHREHVDDHQLQIAKRLQDLGLAISPSADELTLEHLQFAASRRINRLGVS
ncbi:glycosyltransferase [Microbacterium sp. CCNWLW134]|uniref:glycosyltransferase n=1 Tax=Microbacterium sp. CCNWLW134 TaxID=3122064 RepID=UPI00301015D8